MKNRGGFRRIARTAVYRGALLACLAAGAAQAQFYYEANTAEQVDYESNVFALASSAQAVAETGQTRRYDVMSRYAAGLDTDYHWDLQKLYFGAEGRRSLYDYFSQLDHNEYLLNGGLDWTLAPTWNGKFNFRQERTMTLFSNLQSIQLTMQRDRKVQGSSGVDITPEWRFEGSLGNHILALPLPGETSFSLRENSGSAAIKYIGVQKLSAGLEFDYVWGGYFGQPGPDNYYQKSANLTATYVVSGLSSFGAAFGYTQRLGQLDSMQNASGLTGSLSYVRTISGKTTAHLSLSRAVNSYVTSANAEIDSTAEAGVVWQPTLQLYVALDYGWTESKFDGEGVINAPAINRLDHYQNTVLRISYLPLHWLTVQPFFRYQDRHSNIPVDGYNDLQAGVQVVARFGNTANGGDAGIIPVAGY
jgi:hypothetical protein